MTPLEKIRELVAARLAAAKQIIEDYQAPKDPNDEGN